MQISTSALLASQQQIQRAQPRPEAQAAFEPMSFKQAAKPTAATAAPEMPSATGETRGPALTGPVPGKPMRPGTHLDIKV